MARKRTAGEKDKMIVFGDPHRMGPIYKEKDGKNIFLVINNYSKIFIVGDNISNQKPIIEQVLANINHFLYWVDETCPTVRSNDLTTTLLECTTSIERELNSYMISAQVNPEILAGLTDNIDLSNKTDMDYLLITHVYFMKKYIITDEVCSLIYKYCKAFTFGEVQSSKAEGTVMEYEVSNHGNNLAIMVSVFMKFIKLIVSRTISEKILKSTINMETLRKRVYHYLMEEAFDKSSFIYSNFNKIEKVDYFKEFIHHIYSEIDNRLTDNADHINSQHAIYGTTDASIKESADKELINILFKNCIRYGFDRDHEELKKNFKKNFTDTAKANGVLVDDNLDVVYSKDMSLFGYNAKAFIGYVTGSLRSHVANSFSNKKQPMMNTILVETESDGPSAREKVMKTLDKINLHESRMKQKIKDELVSTLASREAPEIKKYLERLKNNDRYFPDISNRSPLTTTILAERVECLGIDRGNPLSYMNDDEYNLLIADSCLWDLIYQFTDDNGYNNIRECLLAKPDKNKPIENTESIYERIRSLVETHLRPDPENQHAIIEHIIRVVSVQYKHADPTISVGYNSIYITLNEGIYVSLLKSILDRRAAIDGGK